MRPDVPFLDGARVERIEVVEDGDRMPFGEQTIDKVAADKPYAARDKHTRSSQLGETVLKRNRHIVSQ